MGTQAVRFQGPHCHPELPTTPGPLDADCTVEAQRTPATPRQAESWASSRDVAPVPALPLTW